MKNSQKETSNDIQFDKFNNEFKIVRKHIYITAILGILAAVYLFDSILYFRSSFMICFFLSVIILLVDIFLIRKYKKSSQSATLVENHKDEFEKLFDKYSKRSIVWMMILFLEVFMLLTNVIALNVNSKSYEVAEIFNSFIFSLEIVFFFFIKNTFILDWLLKKHHFENESKYKKNIKIIAIASTFYWIIGVLLFYVFEKYLVMNITAFIGITFIIEIIICCLSFIKKMLYQPKKMNRLVVLSVVLLIVIFGGYSFLSRDIWLTQPYINATPYIYEGNDKITYDETTGIYTITSNEDDFKILQLTDIHLGGSILSYDKDLKALDACYQLINYTKPDLVVVTGDLSFPMGIMSFSFNNKAPVQQFAAFMRNTGVPWVFTYGNHDTESVAIGNKEDLNDLYQSLSWKTSRTLLYPYTQPKQNNAQIWGRNNQLIEVRNSDGSLNQALFLIDSNAYTGDGLNKYDYIHDDQVDWYKEQILRLNKEENKTISSLGFFHIPLQQYKTAYELYESGSDEVKYFFGSNDEKMIDKICASEYPSKIFDTAKELGSTKGFFCGHDHYNNMSLEYEGIRLTYGMSIDYLAMPGIARDTKQRGATLITSHKDSSIEIEQISLTSIESSSNNYLLEIIKGEYNR